MSRALNYRALARSAFPDTRGWDVKDIRSKCLKPIVEAFMKNVVRTSTFCLMPARLTLSIQRSQLWRDFIAQKRGILINPDSSDYVRNLPHEDKEIIRSHVEK